VWFRQSQRDSRQCACEGVNMVGWKSPSDGSSTVGDRK